MPETPIYRCWSLEGQRRTVQCGLAVLNTLGEAAREGFTRFPHGGVEIGGILVGSVHDDAVRIVSARPLPIEYARGASFALSQSDEDALRKLIETANDELRPRGLEVAGWYVSHTRRELEPNPADIAIYDKFFGKPWQVYIIIKPDKLNPARMAVFFRGEDGVLLEIAAYRDVADDEPKPAEPKPEGPEPVPVPMLEPAITAPEPPPLFQQAAPHRSTLRYWLGALAVLVCASLAWFASDSHKQQVALPAMPAPAAASSAPEPVAKPDPPPAPRVQADNQRPRKIKRVRSRRRRTRKSKAQTSPAASVPANPVVK